SQALCMIKLIARSTRFGDVGVKDLVMLPERPVKRTRKAPKVVPETIEEDIEFEPLDAEIEDWVSQAG
ncbi:hypothetical protein RUND412_005945, partial [Rhizina undulata]